MDELLPKLAPKNKKDIFLYFLIFVACMPLIYLILGQRFEIMLINDFGLILFLIISIFCLVKGIREKRKVVFFKSPAMWLLITMFLWIFLSGFFAYNKVATWLGIYENYHGEDSVWQYMFYFSAAICAYNLKKENIRYLFSVIMIVSCLLILIQFALGDYGAGFVHKNHTGYYLCITLMISIGMFFCQKNALVCTLCIGSIILHCASLILNGSMGPIIGIIVFFAVGLLYVLIHKRNLFVKFLSILACFLVVMTTCDYVPKIREFRDEESTTVEKVVDVAKFALYKIGIIPTDAIENDELSPGSDGYSRLFMWKRAFNNMLELPLFGTGVGSWKSYNPDVPNIKPHNEFLQYGATAGWVTMIAYVALMILLFVKYRKNHKKQSHESFIAMGAIFVYLVQSVFGCVMPFVAPTFFMVVGIAIKEIDLNTNKEIIEKENQEKIPS